MVSWHFLVLRKLNKLRKAILQAQYAHFRAPGPLSHSIASIGYQPGALRLNPQPQLYYSHGTTGLIPSQPVGVDVHQQLLPKFGPGVAPVFMMPYHLQRQQGHLGQRMGVRRSAAHMQQQLIQHNATPGFRYMQNACNNVGPLSQVSLPASASASATPESQLEMVGEQLYLLVERIEREHAGKVTGMLLEMDQTEILHLIESPDALNQKVSEAMDVLRSAHHARGSDAAADQLSSLTLNY